MVLRCGAGEPAGGDAETAVSVRLHEIALAAGDAAQGERLPNEASGQVLRQAYLGSHRDYLVGLGDGTQLRVTAPLAVDVPVGGSVRLCFPPEHCRALAR